MNAKTRPWRSGLSIVSAVLLILAQPPWGLGWLALVALAPLLVALRGAGPGERFLLGWSCGTLWSFGMVGVWLWPAAESALDWGPVGSLAVALAATQIYGGLHLAVFAAVVFAGDLGGRRERLWPLAVAVCWVGIEALRSATFAGVPWGLLGHAPWDRPAAIQAASLAGVAAVSFWVAAVNGALAEAVLRALDGASPRRPLTLAAAVLVVAVSHGSWRLAGASGEGGGEGEAGFAVEVVHSDWRSLVPERAPELVERMIASTRPAGSAAEITILPEASLRDLPSSQPGSAHRLYELARSSSRDLIFGAPRRGGDRLYNSLYLLRPQFAEFVDTYDKRRRVPLAEAHFSAGEEARLMRAGRDRRIAPLLCFEALFPDLVGGYTPGVAVESIDLLLNPTNDVRVGRGAGQQAAMAVFRAVENGIPLLRVANRGPSMLVDGRGRILATAEGWGSELWQVPPPLAATPYRLTVGKLRSMLPGRAAADGPLAWLCLALVLIRVLRALSAVGEIPKGESQIPNANPRS